MNHWVIIITALASLFLVVPLKSSLLVTLRHMTAIYFLLRIGDGISKYAFTLPLAGRELRLSLSIPMVMLGLFLWKFSQRTGCKELNNAWFGTLALMALHLLGLGILCQWHYGYGWQKSPYVFGHLVFLLFIVFLYVPLLKLFWGRLLLIFLLGLNVAGVIQ